MKKQGNKHEIRERLRAVRHMLAAGMDHRAITAIGCEAWGIGREQMRRYLERVYVEWEQLAREDSQPHLRDLAVEQRNEVFRRALQSNRFQEALAALNSRDRIFGLRGDGRWHAAQEGRMTLARLLEEVAEGSGDIQKSRPEGPLAEDCGSDRDVIGSRKRPRSESGGGG